MADLDLTNRDYDSTTNRDRQFPAEGVNGALAVYGCARNLQKISTAGNDATEYAGGFYVESVGTGDWTIYPVDSGSSISFTPVAGTFYPYHVTRIDTTGVTGTVKYIGHV